TTRPSASISTHFFSTVAAFADWVVLVSAFMARSLKRWTRGTGSGSAAPNKPRRQSLADEAALRSGPMTLCGPKVKLRAALLTGIIIPSRLTSARRTRFSASTRRTLAAKPVERRCRDRDENRAGHLVLDRDPHGDAGDNGQNA